jgi:hypothetical protein
MSKLLNIAPVVLTNTAGTNLLNCALGSLSGPIGLTLTQPRVRITGASFINATGSAVSVSLFKGATGAHAAGTEVYGSSLSIPPNGTYIDYTEVILDAADFLTGSGLGVTIRFTGEVEFV